MAQPEQAKALAASGSPEGVAVCGDPIHVAFSTDDNYAPYLAVAIQSIIDARTAGTSYRLYILTDGLTPRNRDLLTGMACAGIGVEIVDVSAKKRQASSFGLHYLSTSTYYRIYLCELLPQLDKIIYLDCDIMACRDLRELWEIELGDAYVGACINLGYRMVHPNERPGVEVLEKEGISYSHYFNAGVLVMNLKAFRQNGLVEKLIGLSMRRDFMWQDQDVLNIVCKDRWLELPQEWNWHFSNTETEMAKEPGDPENAAIAHFAGFKPWNLFPSRYAEQWWRTAFRCPYADALLQSFLDRSKVSLCDRLALPCLHILAHADGIAPSIAARAQGKRRIIKRLLEFQRMRKSFLKRKTLIAKQ